MFVVIHGQARHQVDETVGGWADTDLTGMGVRQAKALGARLHGQLQSAQRSPQLFSSDLTRARKTADQIGVEIGSDVRLRQGLRTARCGAAEEQPRSWLEENAAELPERGDILHYKCAADAESVFEVSERVYPLVADLAQRDAQDIVVVTHSGTHDLVVAAWLGVPQEALGRYSLHTDPGGVTELGVQADTGVRVLVRLNDTDHLET